MSVWMEFHFKMFWRGLANDHSCKIWLQIALRFMKKCRLKFSVDYWRRMDNELKSALKTVPDLLLRRAKGLLSKVKDILFHYMHAIIF